MLYGNYHAPQIHLRVDLSNPEPYLLDHVLGHRIVVQRIQLVHLLLPTDHIDILNLHCPARPEPQPVPQVQHEEDRDCDIRGKEV